MLFPDQHAEAVSVFLCERLSDETRLRLVRRDDAAFILSLRNDPEKGRNLSQTDASLAAQEAWLDSMSAAAVPLVSFILSSSMAPSG